MNIAVFLCGQVRCLEKSYKTILNTFQNHNVDYYFHFWKEAPRKESQFSESFVLDVFKPKNYVFEKQIDFTNQARNLKSRAFAHPRESSTYKVCSQYYSLSRSKDIIEDPNQYDYIAKLRTDMYFNQSIDYLLEEITDDQLLIAHHGVIDFLLGDIAFFTTPKTFANFFNLYEFLINEKYWQKKLQRMTSHYVLEAFVNYYNIDFKHVPFYFTLLRPPMEGNNCTQIMKSYKNHLKKANASTERTMQNMFRYNNPNRVKEFNLM